MGLMQRLVSVPPPYPHKIFIGGILIGALFCSTILLFLIREVIFNLGMDGSFAGFGCFLSSPLACFSKAKSAYRGCAVCKQNSPRAKKTFKIKLSLML